MTLRFSSLLTAALLCAVAPAYATATRPAIENDAVKILAPHKATYDIEMVARHSGSPILNVRGQMNFTLRQDCDGWTTDHEFKMNYDYADGPQMDVSSAFSTYETFDSRSLDFSSRRYRNQELHEEIRGHANASPDKQGAADYSLPAGVHFDLTPNTLFPMAHTMAILSAIKQGDKFVHATIFDGSDEEGPVDVNAFIGKPVTPAAQGEKIAKDLMAGKAWNVRMAFFPASDEGESDYEMDAVLHDNGVVSDMLIEYDEFSVKQHLVALEPLKPASCGADAKK